MNACIYRAALYCDPCAHRLGVWLGGGTCSDSGHCAQGPYADGGGEADSPQHCDACGVFLENPLTSEGREYTKDLIHWFEAAGSGNAVVVNEWRTFYADALTA